MMSCRAFIAALVFACSGCSWLYSTDDLHVLDGRPRPDTPVDMQQIDEWNPLDPQVQSVESSDFLEGMGVEGSRSAIVIVHGLNLGSENTTVSLTLVGTTAATKRPVVDNTAILADKYHHAMLAVPVSMDVDDALPAGTNLTFDVTVTHDEAGTIVSSTLAAALVVKGLDELTAVPGGGLVSGIQTFSRIAIASGTVTAAANQTSPIRLRATASVSIGGAIDISAGTPPAAGPGGGRGGAGGKSGVIGGTGGGTGEGPGGGTANGGSATYAGNDILDVLGGSNRGCGGGGGDASGTGNGGDGGGGGGTLELIAGGDLTIAAVSSKGAIGASAGGIGAIAGGAGGGGIVLVRAGRSLQTGTLDVSGGQQSTAGESGRIRVDAPNDPSVTATVPATPALYRGPAFVNVPLVVSVPTPMIHVVGTDDTQFWYFFTQGGSSSEVLTHQLATGPADFVLGAPLYEGLNHVCLLVSSSKTSDTRSCIDIAYVHAD